MGVLHYIFVHVLVHVYIHMCELTLVFLTCHVCIGAIARGNAAYGQGVGPIFLDDLACTGTEPSLFNCTFDPTHNCNHIEDAGVLCRKCSLLYTSYNIHCTHNLLAKMFV